jgi:hypothetical protein
MFYDETANTRVNALTHFLVFRQVLACVFTKPEVLSSTVFQIPNWPSVV